MTPALQSIVPPAKPDYFRRPASAAVDQIEVRQRAETAISELARPTHFHQPWIEPLIRPRPQLVSLSGQTTTTVPAARRRPPTLRHVGLLIIALASIIFTPITAWAADTAEVQTKRALTAKSDPESLIAAYLLNFVKYIEWPEAIPPTGEPWRIGVLNNERVRDSLDPIVKGMFIRGRLIVIVHAFDAADLSNCQIVLLPSSGSVAAAAAKAFVERPVLTVFYHEKGSVAVAAAIELLLQNQSMRYRLNPSLLTAQGLKATPGLLENSLPLASPRPARPL